MTPQSSVSWGLKMPLPAPVDSVVLAPDSFDLDLGDVDDLEVATMPRIAPVTKPAPRAPVPRAPTEPPAIVPVWALVASGALLFAAVATTVALAF